MVREDFLHKKRGARVRPLFSFPDSFLTMQCTVTRNNSFLSPLLYVLRLEIEQGLFYAQPAAVAYQLFV